MRSDGDSAVNNLVNDECKILALGKQRAVEMGFPLLSLTDMSTYIVGEHVFRILGEAREVFGDNCDAWSNEKFPEDTHSAYLIGATPLVKESKERSLLREIIEYSKRDPASSSEWLRWQNILSEIRDLLAEKPE